MSLYGALNIGVAGLAANSAALSVTSSNIANVNTVGYKDAERQFLDLSQHRRAWAATPRPASSAVISQDVTDAGPAHLHLLADRPVDLGQRLLRGGDQRHERRATRNIPAPAASRPDANGNLVNAAGLYLLGWQLDSPGQCAHQHQRR